MSVDINVNCHLSVGELPFHLRSIQVVFSCDHLPFSLELDESD